MDSIRKRQISPVSISHHPKEPLRDVPYELPQKQISAQFPKEDQPYFLPNTPIYTKHEFAYKETPETRKNKSKFSFLRLIIVILKWLSILGILSAAGYISFFLWKTYIINNKINVSPDSSFTSHIKNIVSSVGTNRLTLDGESEGRINILLLGAAGQHDAGKNLTDTIMIMSIDTKANKVGLMSLPRDLFVKIPNSTSFTKINTLYQIGLAQNINEKPVKETVEQITGLQMHYFAVLNYDGFKKIVDAIDGINVMVERDIYDSRFPGPNFSYQTFELSKGFHELDGETALKYVRERHDDPQGDFGRAKRQQQVMQSVKNKLFSTQIMLDVFALNNILNAIGDNIKTNIGVKELESLLEIAKKLDTQNISTVVVDAWKKDSLLKVSHVMVGDVRAFILVPRIGNYSEIRETADTLFDNEILKKRTKAIEDEKATVAIINASSDPQLARKVRETLAEKIPFASLSIENPSDVFVRENTIVIDNTNAAKIFSIDELIKKLPATRSESSQEKSSADITVVLGNDLIDSYTYDEDSIDEYNQGQDEQAGLIIEQ